jgi:dienelactone hydrolase
MKNVTTMNRLACRGLLLCLAGLPVAGLAQSTEVKLWPGAAPGSETWTRKEVSYKNPQGSAMVRNVVEPALTVYLAAPGSGVGTSVIVAPGGAFRFLSWESEGTQVAEWLQQHGVAAFVLKYRLTDTGTEEEFRQAQGRGRGGAPAGGAGRGGGRGNPAEIQGMAAADGLQAIKVVRQRAAEWRVDPDKIGLMGFSAGGYVALRAALQHTAETKPNFVASIYACCINIADEKVPDDAPPVFFLHAYNDPVSAATPSIFLAWKAANKPGFGMPRRNQPTDGWIERFGDWLRYQKLMKP